MSSPTKLPPKVVAQLAKDLIGPLLIGTMLNICLVGYFRSISCPDNSGTRGDGTVRSSTYASAHFLSARKQVNVTRSIQQTVEDLLGALCAHNIFT